MIPATRVGVIGSRLPFVIENVESARWALFDPVLFCGSRFCLDVQRHRLFESNMVLVGSGCHHDYWKRDGAARFPCATNRTNPRRTCEVGVWRIPLEVQSAAMGITWMDRAALSLAIPPAYTEHLGRQLLAQVGAASPH